jgi:hypothetical protein
LLIGGWILFLLLLWLCAEVFPIMKRDPVVGMAVLLIGGAGYVWALFRFNDWVIGRRERR